MSDKILLIRPQNVYNYNNYPPLNLISLGSSLKSAGYDVRIINSALERGQFETIEAHLENSLLACITILTSEIPDAYKIIRFIKEKSKLPVVVGGWHCTLFPEQMASSQYVDYVVSGEGEEHLVNIADTLRNGKKPEHNIFPKKTVNLDSLPVPAYDLDENIDRFISGYLTDKLSERVKQPMRWLPYESSRGCPSQCTFCINVVSNNTRYRKKSADKVIFEIEDIVRKHKLSHLKIIDDNFFVDIKRVREICRGIIKKKLNITWDAECRCDYFNEKMLNDETLDICKRSGLVQLTLGVESGSPHTLELMKKGITVEQAEYAIKRCDEFGIIARSSFIIEIPGEGLSDIRQTVAFINRLRKYHSFTCGLGTFRPYPKCELTEKLLKEGYLIEPKTFEQWMDRDVIDMYTSAEYIRPWQVNGKYSESASYYVNMESAIRLGNYQIERWIDRMKNSFFVGLARIRNRLMFHRFPIDKRFYKSFLINFYRRRRVLEKSGAYPLSRPERGEA